jgi:hypothetical protein
MQRERNGKSELLSAARVTDASPATPFHTGNIVGVGSAVGFPAASDPLFQCAALRVESGVALALSLARHARSPQTTAPNTSQSRAPSKTAASSSNSSESESVKGSKSDDNSENDEAVFFDIDSLMNTDVENLTDAQLNALEDALSSTSTATKAAKTTAAAVKTAVTSRPASVSIRSAFVEYERRRRGALLSSQQRVHAAVDARIDTEASTVFLALAR